ncbi:hypothetical protein AVEN_146324-1 [Araneus ventricosus]|uniref:FUN14 domain-containing protein 1 n=1 Tax=Araneus ventricosus TaxID=182803 RepID=A0A4Y2J8X1_ARAVE|nr:hypothetical protein AVEN_146324-1 [Araneus ventricosus]
MQGYNVTEFPSASDEDFHGGVNDLILKQFLIGGLCGLVAGRIFARVNKIAALALSGGFFIFHILHHKGYITLDSDKLMESASHIANWRESLSVESVASFFGEDCKFVALGFSGGFILGMG